MLAETAVADTAVRPAAMAPLEASVGGDVGSTWRVTELGAPESWVESGGLEPPCPAAPSAPSSPARDTAARLGRYPAEEALRGFLRTSRSEIEVLLRGFWMPAGIFVAAEAGAYLVVRKSFFEAITNGAFEQWPRFEAVVELHVWASIAMWSAAAVQVLWERPRKTPQLVWIHRRTGQAMLTLFFAVVFPTSLYLTIMQHVDWLSPFVGAVLLDTAICTAYFLFSGWRVVQASRTPRSLALHGRLMQCGIVMSMSILPQRLLQLYLTAQMRTHHQLNYTVSILVTAVLFVLFGHFKEGPRGGIWMASIGTENAEEAFGSAMPSSIERRLWRSRWIVYVVVYILIREWIGTSHYDKHPGQQVQVGQLGQLMSRAVRP